MKHAFRLSRACAALFALAAFIGAAGAGARAQTLSPTPDTAIFQITSTTIPGTPTPTPSATPTPTPGATPAPVPRTSFANDISGSGRFVVIESAGDIATDRSPTRNNADGNQEIFLFDYAQRRIFQITNTRSVLKDATKSSIDPTNVDVLLVNLRPSISRDGRFIVFESNAYSDANPALSPRNFDGPSNSAALKADGNTEIFVYALPEFAAIPDLSQGTEIAPVDLAAGTMTRVTFTPATALPRPGAANIPPFFARDNYGPSVSDDGGLIAFVSKVRSGISGFSNADGNKEIVVYSRTGGTFAQVTTTTDVTVPGNVLPRLVFNDNPSLSACVAPLQCRVAFISNADVGSSETDANRGNGEIYIADLNAASGAATATRQLTRTPPETRTGVENQSVNILSPGRRISRDGQFVAFESTAVFNADGTLNGSLANSYGAYLANVSAASTTFALISPRAPEGQTDVGLRFPTFTGDSTRVVWVTNLNLKSDGTVATTASEGLNQATRAQVFSAPVNALTTVSRVTNLTAGTPSAPHGAFNAVQPFPADTVRRLALSLTSEQGGGNTDSLAEAFYQLIPVAAGETAGAVSFTTGASERPVVAASPTPTPTPSATDVTGLAPGMLAIARSTLTLAPATREVDKNNAHETQRRPPLPVELAGVSVTVSGAAAGLFFVAPNQINFVVPPGLPAATTAAPVVVFNNGSLVRTSVLLNPVQPDIYTSTNGPGGRAAVLNITNPCVAPTGEPFAVTSTRPAGSGTTGDCTSTQTETAPTRLLIMLTGLRPPAGTTISVSVRIGTTDITPVSFGPSNTPGFDQVIIDLPATLAGAGDVPVIVTATAGGVAFTSRPAETAPRITIQ